MYDVSLTPDESQIMGISPYEVYWFNAETFEEERFLSYDFLQYGISPDYIDVSISPTTEFILCELDYPRRGFDLVSSHDGTVRTVEVEDENFYWYEFSKDGKQILKLDSYETWDIEKEEWITGTYNRIGGILHPDGEYYYMLHGGDYSEMRLYRYDHSENRELVQPVGDYYINDFQISPDGRYFSVIFNDSKNLAVWDVTQDKIIYYQCFHKKFCDRKLLQQYKDIQLYKADETLEHPVDAGVFSPNSEILFINIGRHQYFIDLKTGETMFDTLGVYSRVIFYQDSSKALATSGRYLSHMPVRIYDLSIAKMLKESQGVYLYQSFSHSNIQLSPDSTKIGSAIFPEMFLYDIQTGELLYRHEFENTRGIVFDYFHDEDKVLVANTGENGEISIWNYTTDETQYFKPVKREDRTESIQISADDKLIKYSGFRNDKYYIYSLENGKVRKYKQNFYFHPIYSGIVRFLDGAIQFSAVDPLSIKETKTQTINTSICNDANSERVFYGNGENYYCWVKNHLVIFNNNEWHEIVIDAQNSVSEDYHADIAVANFQPFVIVSDRNRTMIYDILHNRKLATTSFPTISLPTPDILQISPNDKYIIIMGKDGILHIYGVPVEE